MPKPRYLLVIPDRLSPPEPVSGLEQASRRYSQLRDESGEGASTWPDGLVNDYASNVARISYNGKVWPMGEWQAGDEPIYSPFAEG